MCFRTDSIIFLLKYGENKSHIYDINQKHRNTAKKDYLFAQKRNGFPTRFSGIAN